MLFLGSGTKTLQSTQRLRNHSVVQQMASSPQRKKNNGTLSSSKVWSHSLAPGHFSWGRRARESANYKERGQQKEICSDCSEKRIGRNQSKSEQIGEFPKRTANRNKSEENGKSGTDRGGPFLVSPNWGGPILRNSMWTYIACYPGAVSKGGIWKTLKRPCFGGVFWRFFFFFFLIFSGIFKHFS